MTALSAEDAAKAIGYGQEQLRLAGESADDAERHGRYVQAAQALSSAGRIVAGLAAAIAPAEPGRWGVAMNFGGAPRPRVGGPAPR
jgi:hypothetical protein